MSNVVTLNFRKPDGTTCAITTHELSAPTTRDHYEKKGFVFLPGETPEPEPEPSEEPTKHKRSR